ncbi:MAG: hypothetical protein K8R40_01710 [Anaerolineaceae bacterium]|nr:hypothetical protein [Anaerolineaceae bacterium]
MKTIIKWIQKHWALPVLIILLMIALLTFANPPWYQTYQSLVWAAGALLTLLLWSVRKKEMDN